jgi:plasmid stabilization system protein ParE
MPSIRVEKIKERTLVLKTHPQAGKIISEFNDENLREIVSGHYRIIYKIISDELIHVLIIHHGARKLERRIKK